MPALTVPKRIFSYTTTSSDASGKSFSVPIPNDFAVASLSIRVKGSITIGTTTALGQQFGGSAGCITNCSIQAKNAQYLVNVSGVQLRLLEMIQNEGHVTQTDIATYTAGDKAFNVTLKRNFQMPRARVQVADRGMFPAHIIRDCVLNFNLVNPLSTAGGWVVPDTGTTAVYKAGTTVEVFIDQVPVSVADPNFYLIEAVTGIEDTNILSSTGAKNRYRLDTGGYLRHLILYSTSTQSSVTRVADDTQIDLLRMYGNNTDVFGQTTWYGNQDDNQDNFHLTSLLTGTSVIDFTRHGSVAEMLDTSERNLGGSSLYLDMNCAASNTAALLGIVAVRLYDNMSMPLISATRQSGSSASSPKPAGS